MPVEFYVKYILSTKGKKNFLQFEKLRKQRVGIVQSGHESNA